MTIRFVTDSTSDYPQADATALGIEIVPLTVFFGDEAFLDAIELDTDNFYAKLQTTKELPRTSQPAPAKFQEAYIKLIDEGATAIISIHLSAKLSGTYQSACSAAQDLPEAYSHVPIEVIDSQQVSLALSHPFPEMVAMAKEGKTVEEIKNFLTDQYARTKFLAMLDNLEFLQRGGRIGAAKALLGNLLSVKPLIGLKDGLVVPFEQPRTRSKAFQRIVQLAQKHAPIEKLLIVASDDDLAKQLEVVLQETFPGEIPHYKLGAVVGTHTGAGIAAIVYLAAKIEAERH